MHVESNAHAQDADLRSLLQSVYDRYGYDFRDYAPGSLRRRLEHMLQQERVSTIEALRERLFTDPACIHRFVVAVTVTVTGLFRDPGFYLALRHRVLPILRALPFIRIWHAGCSTGEEVYSLAILLEEEQLYRRCRIYATDVNAQVLQPARSGIVALQSFEQYCDNYRQAGGQRDLSTYCTAKYGHLLFQPALRKNIVFSQHNLATDGVFHRFDLILCRNVMIYFNKRLMDRAHGLLYESLNMQGFLALGSRESLRFTPYEDNYKSVDRRYRLAQKVQ